MSDPHVVALHYRLETGPQLVFADREPLKCETEGFTVRLADGQLRLELKDHFPTAEAAQAEVETFLRSWAIATALHDGTAGISFVFERADIIDRDPPALGDGAGSWAASGGATARGAAPTQFSPARYPDPPAKFTASPDVVVMWDHYQRYKEGREPLAVMAQCCLKNIEWSAGGKRARRAAARQYAIDIEVLRRLVRLTSVVGDAQTGPTAFLGGFRPHSPAEVAWIEAVVRLLIQRAGEWAADRQTKWAQITMEDLPNL